MLTAWVRQCGRAYPHAALTFTPRLEAEQLKISLGYADYTLNRLFEGMLREFVRTKFSRINPDSANELEVTIRYLNVEERFYLGSQKLHRLDMTVEVTLREGEKTIARHLSFHEEADAVGYSLRSDQIYNLLLRFIIAIDRLSTAQFGR